MIPFRRGIPVFHAEPGLFEKMAGELNVSLEHIEPAQACASYLSFLLETANMSTYEGSMTVLFAARKAYLESRL